jgi:hypothetical protein
MCQRSHTRAFRVAGGIGGSILVASACTSGGTAPLILPPRTSVQEANGQSGDSSWFVHVNGWAPQTQLALWASPYTARFGDTLSVYIHATRGPVAVTVYRLGWYGGMGGHVVFAQDSVAATAQPACSTPFPGPVVCPWTRTMRVPIGDDWVSGVYLIKATDQTRLVGYYPFVLTDTRPAQFVAVVPQFTWQAYNAYGGSSLYTAQQSADASDDTVGNFGHFVSFERPYGNNGGAMYILDDFKSHDLRDIRFLERNGYDLTYASSLDVTEDSRGLPQPQKGIIFIGHDEYWTYHERSVVQGMRDRHTHLAFLSGNNAFWNVRLSIGPVTRRAGDVLTCYKLDRDPSAAADSLTTTEFRMKPVSRPEDALVGIEYVVGTQTLPLEPLVVSDTAVGPEAASFLAAAGLHAGEQIPAQIGIEGDRVFADTSSPSKVQVLFKSPIAPKFAVPYAPFYYTTFYVAPSGAGVFAAGDVEWGRGLDGFNGTVESPALQSVTKAVLNWMSDH